MATRGRVPHGRALSWDWPELKDALRSGKHAEKKCSGIVVVGRGNYLWEFVFGFEQLSVFVMCGRKRDVCGGHDVSMQEKRRRLS